MVSLKPNWSPSLNRRLNESWMEWNVRLSEVATAPLVQRMRATFETYWANEAFERFWQGPVEGREELGDHGPDREEAARQAFRWARAAGDRASAMWLPVEADRWYRRALDVATAAGASSAERIAILRARTANVNLGVLTADEAEGPVSELAATNLGGRTASPQQFPLVARSLRRIILR